MQYLRPVVTPLVTVLFIFIFLYVFSFLFGPLPLSVKSTNSSVSDMFTVSAVGEADTTAQNASFTVGVTKSATTAEEAQNQVNTVMNQIIAEMKKVGVEEQNIKTESINVNPEYDFSTGRQVERGYMASQNVRVKAPTETANQALDAATAKGANVIYGVSFELDDEDREKLEADARNRAIQKAKEKAKTIADAAGIRLGRLVNISEYPEASGPIPMYSERSAIGAADMVKNTDLQPGENTIRINVTLFYETL